MADVKGYKSKTKSLSSSQVLFRDYKFSEGETIAKEMMDQLCLDMAAKKLATDSVSLYVGYSYTYGVPGAGGDGTANVPYQCFRCDLTGNWCTVPPNGQSVLWYSQSLPFLQ